VNVVQKRVDPSSRAANITIPVARQRSARLSVNGKTLDQTLQVPKQSLIQLLAEL